MAIFAIADTHLSFGSQKPMDIFTGWADYAQRLEMNWRDAVAQGDTVVLPGDISWGMSLDEALPDFAFLHRLPGTKIILKGNHDYWWNTRKKIEGFWAMHGLDSLRLLHNSAVLAEGFAICGSRGWFFDDADGPDNQKVLLREAGRLRTSIQAGKALVGGDMARLLVFLHYPPMAGGQTCQVMFDVLQTEGVRRCYYGHLHGQSIRGAFRSEAGGVRFELVSADALGFRPKRCDLLP